MKKYVCTALVISGISFAAHAHLGVAERKPASLVAVQPILIEDQSATPLELDVSNPWHMVGLYNNPLHSPVTEFIRLAKASVDIEIYEMADPDVRQALREVMAKHVTVRIVKEPKPVGQSCDPWGNGLSGRAAKHPKPEVLADCQDQQHLVQEIQNAGGAFVPFNKKQLCGQEKKKGICYEHGKMILVDGKAALVSSGNFNSSNLCDLKANPKTCNRDYSYITRDEQVVGALKEIFTKDLTGTRFDLKSILARPGLAGKITVSPYSLDPLVGFLKTAQRRIQIQNQYINMSSGLADVLLAIAQDKTRKVAIEIELADVCAFGKVTDRHAYDLYLMFSALEDAGVQIRMFDKRQKIDGKEGYLHAKAIVIDGQEAWIGSVNGSNASLNENREYGIFYSQNTRVQQLSRFMSEDFQAPTSQTWRDSLRCRHVGHDDANATHTDDDQNYGDFLNVIMDAGGGSTDDEAPAD